MRVLLVHNRYRQAGGEDAVFAAESDLLKRHGHEVEEWIEDNARIGRMPRVRLAIDTIWSSASAERLRTIVGRARPDVAHFHNTFPLISPSAYAACRTAGVPVVQTLHNYRLICPNGLLWRDGHPCEDCVGRALAWPGSLHACYRSSRSQSAVVAGMLAAHRLRGTWRRDVNVFVALTQFARNKFIAGGLPEGRIVVKPNFLAYDPGAGRGDGGHFLYAGRLAPEKGIHTLLEAWSRAPRLAELRIAGTGPLEPLVREAEGRLPGVRYVGQLSRAELVEQMRSARALVFPSEWFEGMPMTILEAFACGRPVIAARLGGIAEIVRDGVMGVLFAPADAADLAARLEWALAHASALQAMGASARQEYEARYTPERNYPLLMEIYRRAASGRAGSG